MSDSIAEREADARARRAAVTRFDAPVVLSAGAGTGKTTVLVARVLAWSVGPGWLRAERALAAPGLREATPERVAERVLSRCVAITFTEAAAAEMESRTLAAFAAVARGEPVLNFDPEDAGSDPAALARRARALLAAFDHFQVQTIHAFCRRLLAAHPIEAGLHPRFTVDARGDERAAAVRAALEERLAAMAEQGDADLEALLPDGVGAPELEEIVSALAAAAVPAAAFAADPLAPERIRAWAEALREPLVALAAAEDGRFAKASRVGKALETLDAVHASLRALADAPATAAELARVVGSLRDAWSGRVARIQEWAKPHFTSSERAALGESAVQAVAEAARGLLPRVVHALEIDAERLARLHRVVAALLARVEQRLAEAGAESFDALLRRTRELLVRHPAVAAEERRQIDQLLVDEFQDTDRMQCDVVAALALEGDAGERPGLFLVGDPKQSVYGWRSADIAAYMRFVERVARLPGAACHALCVNYRSLPAVLDEVERAVAPVMLAADGVQPPFQRLLPSAPRGAAATRDAAPAVEYWWTLDWDADAAAFVEPKSEAAAALEARHLAADLVGRHADGVAWKRMAVLFRATSNLDDYLGELRRAGVPYEFDRDRSFYRRREIREAAALARLVLDPHDAIALVATLRSAWVGVPDAAWRPLWRDGLPRAASEAIEGGDAALARVREIAAAAAEQVARLAIPGLAALAGWDASLVHAIEVLRALRRSFASDPVDVFVERLRTWTLLEATEAARHPGAFRVANLARFFRELQGMLEECAGDVAAVLRALRADDGETAETYEGRPRDPDEDAVQVMTIHGAKGLDFEHVYLMQTHKERGRGAAGPLDVELCGDVAEWRCAAGGGIASLGHPAVEARRARVEEAEAVRTLYVALTRAKQRLVVAGVLRARSDGSHAALLWRSRGEALVAARAAAERALGEGDFRTERDLGGAQLRFLGARAPADATC
ncbi:MAG: hypothetical protein DCC71_24730, partial [Proteobacteria bacterium]